MNKRLMQLLSLCLGLLVLSGCASYVSVSATRFHEFEASNPPKITNFQFTQAIQTSDDLEQRQYARVISRTLSELGISELKGSSYLLEFKTSAPKSILQSIEPIMEPMFFCTGVGVNRFCGPRNIGAQGARQVSYEIYRNTLEIEFLDAKTGKRIWQAKAEAPTPGEPAILNVLPYLVRTVMESFPGESGKLIRLNYPLPD